MSIKENSYRRISLLLRIPPIVLIVLSYRFLEIFQKTSYEFLYIGLLFASLLTFLLPKDFPTLWASPRGRIVEIKGKILISNKLWDTQNSVGE